MPSSMIGDVNTNAVLNFVLLHNNNGDGARSPSFLMPSWLVLPLPSASARSRARGARAAPFFIFYRGGGGILTAPEWRSTRFFDSRRSRF